MCCRLERKIAVEANRLVGYFTQAHIHTFFVLDRYFRLKSVALVFYYRIGCLSYYRPLLPRRYLEKMGKLPKV